MKTFLEIHVARKTIPLLALLEVVTEKQDLTLGAVTNRMESSISFMSKLVESAISSGYVTSSKQKLDRRVKLLSATPKGRAFLQKHTTK